MESFMHVLNKKNKIWLAVSRLTVYCLCQRLDEESVDFWECRNK